MIRKSLIVSFFSFIIYFIPAFFIWYYKAEYKLGSLEASAFEFFFYSFPVIIITFIVLLIFNFRFSRKIDRRSIVQNNKFYFVCTGGFAILLTLGFTFFDYCQFNKFGYSGSFLDILINYSEVFLFILIVLLLNRKICFNDFKNK
jgi:hypothetical protein